MPTVFLSLRIFSCVHKNGMHGWLLVNFVTANAGAWICNKMRYVSSVQKTVSGKWPCEVHNRLTGWFSGCHKCHQQERVSYALQQTSCLRFLWFLDFYIKVRKILYRGNFNNEMIDFRSLKLYTEWWKTWSLGNTHRSSIVCSRNTHLQRTAIIITDYGPIVTLPQLTEQGVQSPALHDAQAGSLQMSSVVTYTALVQYDLSMGVPRDISKHVTSLCLIPSPHVTEHWHQNNHWM
jgi:hypothetical protein